MLKRHLVLAALAFAWVVGSGSEVLAEDVVIVAIDSPLHWELQGVQSDGGALKVPVKVGDVLHFVFSADPDFRHGIAVENQVDLTKVQKRDAPPRNPDDKDKPFLQELGDGPSRFGLKLPQNPPAKPNEEITQLKVLPEFQGSLSLMCTVHFTNMLVTLERSD